MEYFFSQVAKWDTSKEHKHRLYAYPSKPVFTEGSLIIMDSGAYGLSKAGNAGVPKKMFPEISQRYEAYPDALIHVAPDHFLSPLRSLENWDYWHQNGLYPKISPVIQFGKKGKIDDARYQINEYLKRGVYTEAWCIGNCGLKGHTYAGSLLFQALIEDLRSIGVQWIHVLGAGWDEQDILDWAATGVDSIDSVAWYNKVKTKDQALALSAKYQSVCDMVNTFK